MEIRLRCQFEVFHNLSVSLRDGSKHEMHERKRPQSPDLFVSTRAGGCRVGRLPSSFTASSLPGATCHHAQVEVVLLILHHLMPFFNARPGAAGFLCDPGSQHGEESVAWKCHKVATTSLCHQPCTAWSWHRVPGAHPHYAGSCMHFSHLCLNPSISPSAAKPGACSPCSVAVWGNSARGKCPPAPPSVTGCQE